jgi:hypothetical protein
VRLLRLHANRGKGAALKIGVRESVGDIVLIVRGRICWLRSRVPPFVL